MSLRDTSVYSQIVINGVAVDYDRSKGYDVAKAIIQAMDSCNSQTFSTMTITVSKRPIAETQKDMTHEEKQMAELMSYVKPYGPDEQHLINAANLAAQRAADPIWSRYMYLAASPRNREAEIPEVVSQARREFEQAYPEVVRLQGHRF